MLNNISGFLRVVSDVSTLEIFHACQTTAVVDLVFEYRLDDSECYVYCMYCTQKTGEKSMTSSLKKCLVDKK